MTETETVIQEKKRKIQYKEETSDEEGREKAGTGG